MTKRAKQPPAPPPVRRRRINRQARVVFGEKNPIKLARITVIQNFPNLGYEDLDNPFYMERLKTALKQHLPGRPSDPLADPKVRAELEKQIAS